MPTTDVVRLRAQLRRHAPNDAREAASLRRTVALLDWLRAPLDETADPTHVTGSAIVVDDDRRVLLHRHKRLGIWLQPGGHVDPGESCEDAAVREVLEETGVVAVHVLDAPVHVDVHQGPRGHVHLDVRWLLHAAGRQVPDPAPGESPDVAWLHPDEALDRTDEAARGAIRAALAHLAQR
jgi:8-oxo-dGTP pyrophosphatase MutT (NUDIX family)